MYYFLRLLGDDKESPEIPKKKPKNHLRRVRKYAILELCLWESIILKGKREEVNKKVFANCFKM